MSGCLLSRRLADAVMLRASPRNSSAGSVPSPSSVAGLPAIVVLTPSPPLIEQAFDYPIGLGRSPPGGTRKGWFEFQLT